MQYLFQKDVHEDLLCVLFLPTNTTTTELFKSLNDSITGRLNWMFCVSVCTDGVATVTTQIKVVAFECESTHYIIHQEMLAI